MRPTISVDREPHDGSSRFRSLCSFARMESSDRMNPIGRTLKTTRAERDRSTAAAVLAHPVRVRVLEILNERDMSPVEFFREGFAPTEMDVSQDIYHFRELAEY